MCNNLSILYTIWCIISYIFLVQGVEMFVNSVIKDLKHIEAEGTHILLGIDNYLLIH